MIAALGASPNRPRQGRDDVFTQLASALGERPEDLKRDVATGRSLAEIAHSKGVSPEDLDRTVRTALRRDLPNASEEQLASISKRLTQPSGGVSLFRRGPVAAGPTATAAPTTTASLGRLDITA